ncbi:SusC/RagA family TonB-linked outer membrane protein [Fodinibius salsisoli]|uniref:TonB-dependent receptor n=1 Tax=Fodinibius salsisoli TaxID=2820877 RepID=A0ABT3PJY8_9BACT|nr:TonB-dependent receptor [Fodinibius salsisoli]MCW9706078.1 TonB-dependent receptor [Fodinibius salsisoli]
MSSFTQAQTLGSLHLSPDRIQAKELVIEEGVGLAEAIERLEGQFNVVFLYRTDVMEDQRVAHTLVLPNNVEKALTRLLKGKQLEFKYLNPKTYGIFPAQKVPEEKQLPEAETVSGTVTDAESGETLPAVNVSVKGTTFGASTDAEGRYELANVPSLQDTLIFSFIGYQTQEVPINGRREINISLTPKAIAGEEVVVVGYGTQKKVNLTGSVSSVDFSGQAESRPITNVSSALSGLSSGVTIRQSEGKPGEDGASIRIRGLGTLNNNDPLVMIDGMEGNLDAVNPDNIESISILKDAASAAIYGSRAANGVILITTKTGNKEQTTVSYSGNISVSSPTNLLEFVSDYPKYMKLINESAQNISMPAHFSSNTIEAWKQANANPSKLNENGVPNWLAYPNTNWATEMYESNMVQKHTISVNGGSKNSRYLLSAGYLDNPGLVENTGAKRYNIRFNLESNITDWLVAGTRTYALQQDKELGNYDSMLNFMRQSTPGLIGKHNGKYGYPEAPEESATANNLYSFLNGNEGSDRLSRINATIYSKISFLEELSWDFNFNYSRRFDEYNSHTNGQAQEKIRFSTGKVMSQATPPDLMSTYYRTYANESYTLENILRYSTLINENHDIGALMGYNESYYFSYDHNGQKRGLIDQSISTLGAATDMLSIGGNARDYAIRSWFGRANYAYKQKYLFEANFRYDGSSRFNSDNRWGVFPSFSAGWRLSEEGFIQDLLPGFDNIKLRGSWGQLGNNASGNYDYQAVYGGVGYSFGGNQVAGLRPTKIANPFLRWETTTMTNAGLDIAAIESKLTAEFDVYNKVTDGILTVPPINLTTGLIGAPTRNTAEVTNKGVELNLGWRDQIGEVSYSISGNIAFNNNEVTKYKGKLVEGWLTNEGGDEIYETNLGDVSSGGMTRILEEHKINEYYLLDPYQGSGNHFHADGSVNPDGGPTDGIVRTEEDMEWLKAMVANGNTFLPNQSVAEEGIWYGDYIYADHNNDGVYGNAYDRNFMGSSSMPKYTFGVNMRASWKNFDMSMVWSGQAGFDLYWNESGYNRPNTRIGFQVGKILANDHYYYNPDDPNDPKNNINATYPRLKLDEGDPQNIQASSAWLYDASFVKLRNLTIGYTLPDNIASRIMTRRVRVYFSAENLLTITSFPGLDPEMGANTNYPIMRQVSLGININF